MALRLYSHSVLVQEGVSVRLGYSPDWPEGSHSCRDLVSLTGPRSLLCFCVSPYPLMVAALMWDFLVPLIIIKMINCTSGAVLCGIYTVFTLGTIKVSTPQQRTLHDVDEAGVAARFLEVHAELL